MKTIFLVSGLMVATLPVMSQRYIADHTVAKEEVLRNIPLEYINKAREELHIAYQHTSHGTHVSYGAYGLPDYKTGDDQLFAIAHPQEEGKLHFRDYALNYFSPEGVDASDLSRDETAFIQTTRIFLDLPQHAHYNVIMWSWCDIAGHDVEHNYLPGMDSLIAEYGPGGSKIGTGEGQRENPVTFIFMTGHANENANVGELNPESQAELITANCNTHGYFCLDYYSIDTHDMDDNYWEDAGDNGNSASYGGNFYEDWQNSHILGADYYENKEHPGGEVMYGAHNTQHITANRKAYAFWWILARIAGWNGDTSNIAVSQIIVSSEGGATTVNTGEMLQLSAEVLPSDATNKNISWSVVNQTGEATITQDGLLTAVSEGIVDVVAASQDGSSTTGSLQITISDQVVLITSVNVNAEGGLTEIFTGETLQFTAEVLPEDASDKAVTWSVENLTGEATITENGLLTAVLAGTVTVIASSQDGSGIFGEMQITIVDPTILVTSVVVTSEDGITELYVDSTLQFFAEVSPENATNKNVTWSVESITGEAIITQDGLLTAISTGTVNIVATADDGSGVWDSKSIQITEQTTSITDDQLQHFIIYPNPTSGSFFVQNNTARAYLIKVCDILGKEVYSSSVLPGKSPMQVHLGNSSSGIYIIDLFVENGTIKKGVLIVH